MKLHITNEYSQLKSAVVCWGKNMTPYEKYKTDEIEFKKYHPYSWNIDTLLKEQEKLYKLLETYHVRLIFPKMEPQLIWQMFTRDTAFVIGSKLYYSTTRKFGERSGEIEALLSALSLSEDQQIKIDAAIEGGDVIVVEDNSVYVGRGSRTSVEAIAFLENNVGVKKFELGDYVMHLDTRLTVLPNNIALVNVSAFDTESLEYIKKRYSIIEVFDDEAKNLGTNVFVLNPETILVPQHHKRVAQEIQAKGFKTEILAYTEPIHLGGSIRCTMLPLERED